MAARFRRFARAVAGFGVGLAIVGAIASAGIAHQGASGVVKERMDGMKAMASALGGVIAMARGEAAFDAARIDVAAGTIAEHAEAMVALFPAGTDHPPTRALATVWAEPGEFEAAASELARAGRALARAGAGGLEEVRPALAVVGRACSSCHERYRAPDN